MNINVNKRNKTKLVEKLRWYTYKINMTLADNYPILQNLVSNKSWYIAISSNDIIYEFYYLNIHEYEWKHKK